ncbi:organomercurial lyase [Haloarcula amylovorans]|uniref:organomercurial lyase n=1 Tax=Haloarcula amylovorans TaxID=2562280 RepID=UPI00107624D1|nr:organomercurial lyase [Halomicroarcula amylolytica]
MADDTIDWNGLGPELDLETFDLPPDVAAGLGRLYGTDPPRTGEEWVRQMRAARRETVGREPTVEDLCTTEDGLHAFVGREHRQEYVCVLDPLMVPFLTGDAGTVRSRTPERDAIVEIRIDEAGIDCSHPDAVVSLGVSEHLDGDGDPTLERIYRQVCGYVHVFEDEAEYETWATEIDAATTSVPAATGIAIGRELAATLFESAE